MCGTHRNDIVVILEIREGCNVLMCVRVYGRAYNEDVNHCCCLPVCVCVC